MINLQPKYLMSWQRKILPFIIPDIILTPSQKVIDYLKFFKSRNSIFHRHCERSKFASKRMNEARQSRAINP